MNRSIEQREREQEQQGAFIKPHPPAPHAPSEVPFGSNEIRLTGRQWLAALVLILIFIFSVPAFYTPSLDLAAQPDYRIPYNLNNDYYFIEEYFSRAAETDDFLVLGDSVIWGRYVEPDAALPAQLSERSGRRFRNLGVNGIHPLALYGLIRHYGESIHDRPIIINFNPLWMSSPEADLSASSGGRVNHPSLLPQFDMSISAYDEKLNTRLGVVIRRMLPLFAWTSHLQVVYFDNLDLPQWTLEHPLQWPKPADRSDLPPEEALPDPPRHWQERRLRPMNFPWLEPEDSLQWRFFRETVALLQARGNTVFVIVGPFNEHMLATESIDDFHRIRREIAAWLDANDIPHWLPEALPSELYADASHPLAPGYTRLARELLDRNFLEINR